VPESRRGKYLVQGFQIAQRHPRVREMLQYLMAQPARKYRFFDTSIVSTRGKVSASFKALQRWASGALSSGQIARSPVLAFGGGGGGGGGGQPPYTDPNTGGAAPTTTPAGEAPAPAPTPDPGGGTTPPAPPPPPPCVPGPPPLCF
jgi:hypothetical protein